MTPILVSTELQAGSPRPSNPHRATPPRLSGLPPGLTLGSFDWSFQPAADRKRVETLATCGFVREHDSLVAQARKLLELDADG